MAIVKMNKISIIGLNSIKTALIKELMDLGVVEISSQDSKLTDEEWSNYIDKDGDENKLLNLESYISKVNDVISSLDKYDLRKKPMFFTRKVVEESFFENVLKRKEEIDSNVNRIIELNNKLNELNTEENKTEALIMSLKPWSNYNIPVEFSETKNTIIFTGVIPFVADIVKLTADVEQITDSCIINQVSSDKEQIYLSVICMINEYDDVYDLLKQYGFNIVTFKDTKGTVSENIMQFENKLKDLSTEKKKIESSITEYVSCLDDIQIIYDYLIMERDKCKILNNVLKTEKTFYLSGWVPYQSKKNVEDILKEKDCWYEIIEPEKDEAYPILLENNSFAQPFESITELYSLPSSSNIDPTAIMAPFYFIFFGLMLADVGYGLIMSAACFFISRKFNLEGSLKKMINMFFYCGISTIFWGIMFGSWFGDAFTTIAKVMFNTEFVIKPIWINPIVEPMVLLIFSLVFGLIHLFVGMAIKAYMLIRDGHPLDALYDIGFWYGFIIGISLWLFGNTLIQGSNVVGKWMTIVFAIGLILTQGRQKEGIISKLLSGVLSLYGITSYLSDVLSYSRLLALGLATGVISSVISVLGSLGGTGFFASILLIVVLLFGHTFNIAINSLGTFVHAARLQYVEFFGKFYEGGGDAFNPLTKNTKYIKIIR